MGCIQAFLETQPSRQNKVLAGYVSANSGYILICMFGSGIQIISGNHTD